MDTTDGCIVALVLSDVVERVVDIGKSVEKIWIQLTCLFQKFLEIFNLANLWKRTFPTNRCAKMQSCAFSEANVATSNPFPT